MKAVDLQLVQQYLINSSSTPRLKRKMGGTIGQHCYNYQHWDRSGNGAVID
jgi:hypothetical protein